MKRIMETIKLTIDNKEVEVSKGTTILKAAKELGIDIPTLCYMELHDMGIENKPAGCRICVAEVSGRRNLAPTCSTKCEPGMVVKTHTPRVLNARRTVMEFIFPITQKIVWYVQNQEHANCRQWLTVWESEKYLVQNMLPFQPTGKTHPRR